LGEDQPLSDSSLISSRNNPQPISFWLLPPELVFLILSRLNPYDLCALEGVCRLWRQFATSKSTNFLWYQFCMKSWWESAQRPSAWVSKKDRLKDWKAEYVRLCPAEDFPLRKPKISSREKCDQFEVIVPTKDEMRAHYKSIRSKPKGKRNKGAQRAHQPTYDYNIE